MNFNERLNQLKESAKSKLVKADATPEELEEANKFIKEFDDLESEYSKVVEDKQKLTNLVVDMVKNEGNAKVPPSEDGNKTPRTMEQICADLASESNK